MISGELQISNSYYTKYIGISAFRTACFRGRIDCVED